MITVRQLERLWQAKAFARMSALLLEMRPESSPRLVEELSRALPIAALCIIRLDELSQSYHPFCSRMIRTLLAAQEADGGFGDALATALAIRALSCCNGHGPAIDRGLEYLANLQREDGSWPKVPIRRLPGDSFTTAAILFYLADHARFTQTSRPTAALSWLNSQGPDELVKIPRSRQTPQPTLVWS